MHIFYAFLKQIHNLTTMMSFTYMSTIQKVQYLEIGQTFTDFFWLKFNFFWQTFIFSKTVPKYV